MRRQRSWLRLLSVAARVTMLAAVLPLASSPVSAAPSTRFSPGTGPTGHAFVVSGPAFGVAEPRPRAARFPPSSGSTASLTTPSTTDTGGIVVGDILGVPDGTKQGLSTLSGSGGVSKKKASTAAADVADHPVVTIPRKTVRPGSAATIVGSGFGSSRPVSVTATIPLYTGDTSRLKTTVQTNGRGDFATQLAIPYTAAAGRVTITARSTPEYDGSAVLTIRNLVATVTVSPASIIPGGTITVQGSGYLAGDRITISALVTVTNGARRTLTTATMTTSRGRFSASLHIPGNLAGGTATVVARSAASGSAPVTHLAIAQLAPALVAVPTTAEPGSKMTVNGSGFAAGETITLTLNGRRVASARSTAAGTFSLVMRVPSNLASGSYSLAGASASGMTAAVTLAVSRQVSTTSYIAALYTGRGYHEYLTFLNPGDIPAHVTITYEPTVDRPRSKAIAISPHSRFTEDVNADLGVRVSASAAIAADVPIAVSRMVFHGAAMAVDPGVPSPSTTWYFANGNTSQGYHEYVAVGNPNPRAVQVALRVQPTHRRSFTIDRTLGPLAHTTFSVNRFVQDAVGIRLTANGPIVANRTDYIQQGFMSKTGVTQPQRIWYFAAGPLMTSVRDWIAVTNTSPNRTIVTLRAYGPGGQQVGIKQAWLQPEARKGYLVNRLFHRTNVSVVVTSSRPVVVERMTYSGLRHRTTSDVFGIANPSTSWAFSTANTTPGSADSLDVFNPNLRPIPVVVQFYTASGRVTDRTYVVNPLSQAHIDVNSVEPNEQLGLVVTSTSRFVAMNHTTVNDGTGGDVSQGIAM